MKELTDFSASFLERPLFSATAEISSALFNDKTLLGWAAIACIPVF
jgi:hypothetical protein